MLTRSSTGPCLLLRVSEGAAAGTGSGVGGGTSTRARVISRPVRVIRQFIIAFEVSQSVGGLTLGVKARLYRWLARTLENTAFDERPSHVMKPSVAQHRFQKPRPL